MPVHWSRVRGELRILCAFVADFFSNYQRFTVLSVVKRCGPGWDLGGFVGQTVHSGLWLGSEEEPFHAVPLARGKGGTASASLRFDLFLPRSLAAV